MNGSLTLLDDNLLYIAFSIIGISSKNDQKMKFSGRGGAIVPYAHSTYKTTHQIVSLHHYKRSRVKYSSESTDISFPPGSVSGPRRLTPSPATLNLAKHKASGKCLPQFKWYDSRD